MGDKKRLDDLLVARGLAPTKSRAQRMIMAGLVLSGTQRLDKAGQKVPVDLPITLKQDDIPWVSRGGLKLLHALEANRIDVDGVVALDIGASTGGFTDVLLSRGVVKVYAVDVGYGQLHEKLVGDPRVVVLERTNARYLDQTLVPEPIDLVVCDASFIPLYKVLPAALKLTKKPAQLIALIKPQFEVEKKDVGKGGVVRDPSLHQQVCDNVRNWLEQEIGWKVHCVVESPIKGPKGNTEFLIHASRT